MAVPDVWRRDNLVSFRDELFAISSLGNFIMMLSSRSSDATAPLPSAWPAPKSCNAPYLGQPSIYWPPAPHRTDCVQGTGTNSFGFPIDSPSRQRLQHNQKKAKILLSYRLVR